MLPEKGQIEVCLHLGSCRRFRTDLLNVALSKLSLNILTKKSKKVHTLTAQPRKCNPVPCDDGLAETALMGVVSSPHPDAVNECGIVVQVERAPRTTAARGRGSDVHSLF